MILDLDTCLNKSSFRYSFKRNTNLLKHVSNRNQERFNLEVEEREKRRWLQAWESFEPWSLLVESGGTMLLGSARKLEESNKINQMFKPRYLHQFSNSCTKTWLNARVFTTKETWKTCI